MSAPPVPPPPDGKDWTWASTEVCVECGYDGAALDVADLPRRTRVATAALADALARPGAATRPAAQVWSPLEYACHVRDVCNIFDERLRLMLTQDDPLFANWDQDETAVAERYWAQDPGVVAGECIAAGERTAASFELVRGEQWQRPGRRSNGSVFTVDSFGRYFLHDLVHHLHDVGTSTAAG